MTSASERSYTRRDTVMFLACLGLSLVGLFSPQQWGHGIADTLRDTVLAPLVWLQARAEEGTDQPGAAPSRHGPARLRVLPRPGHPRRSPPRTSASASSST